MLKPEPRPTHPGSVSALLMMQVCFTYPCCTHPPSPSAPPKVHATPPKLLYIAACMSSVANVQLPNLSLLLPPVSTPPPPLPLSTSAQTHVALPRAHRTWRQGAPKLGVKRGGGGTAGRGGPGLLHGECICNNDQELRGLQMCCRLWQECQGHSYHCCLFAMIQ